ncbi:MAG: hypothetical protein C0593_03290 [Marinilabiliales bacterium]|nr:MAG: hypothetical protein C0593_03290 [Marinilabiliales bacterium]
MKKLTSRKGIVAVLAMLFFLFAFADRATAQEPVIIDHSCINLESVPVEWIGAAKENLWIGYGHTSHGSQLISGMNALESYFENGLYDWSHDGGEGKLHLFEGDGYGDGYLDHDCGYTGWDDETREYLDLFPECNVIIWSWCGQVNGVYLSSHYLQPMEQLEADYPDVTFVYMTGHLEGEGPEGSLYIANQEIRDYCSENDKILFDFADIEKYSPEADTNFQEYYANDECNYIHPAHGTKNWALDWLGFHQGEELELISQHCSSCAHSVSLNCVKKGIACWFLWARIAGWDGVNTGVHQSLSENVIKIYPNPATDMLYIETSRDIERVEIYDIHGREISNTNNLSISTTEFNNGIYILRFIMKNGDVETRKVIIQH